mmetsp:Transcript_18710/g.31985  ORF Transcript_18710/g.31985 Transcript_18710/m.31985 type:complete len:87 (+) Transcript_18710:188-448(+)
MKDMEGQSRVLSISNQSSQLNVGNLKGKPLSPNDVNLQFKMQDERQRGNSKVDGKKKNSRVNYQAEPRSMSMAKSPNDRRKESVKY